MKVDITNWQERFNELVIRERLLIVMVAVSFVYFVFDAVLMMDLQKKQKFYQLEISKWVEQNGQISEQIKIMASQLKSESHPKSSSSIDVLQAQVAETDNHLENIIVKFVKPKQIAQVLRNILKKEKGLRLVNMRSIAAVELFVNDIARSNDDLNMRQRQVAKLLQFYQEREENGLEPEFNASRAELQKQQLEEDIAKKNIPKIYKHGIVLELVGDYSGTLRYLKNLENLPWKFYWDAVRYEVTNHPKAKVSILINTISLDKDWVRV